MTREHDSIEALRSYARDIEQSVGAESLDAPLPRVAVSQRTRPARTLRFNSFAASLAVLAVLVVGVVLTRDGVEPTVAPGGDPEALTETVSAKVLDRDSQVTAIRAVARLRSVGLDHAATVVEAADRSGITETEPGASFVSALVAAIDAWVAEPVGDIASDPVVVAAVEGLSALATPPATDPASVAPGQDDEFTPPGQDDEFTPPGQDDEFTPPGLDDEPVPPGQDDEFTPPGRDEEPTPPGRDEEAETP